MNKNYSFYKMKINRHKKVGEIVSENIKAAHVFKKHNIDFCCGGGKEIHKACKQNKIDYSKIKKELLAVNDVRKKYDYDSWDLNRLIDHIVDFHHKYVNESIIQIREYGKKVSKVHGHHYKEVIKIGKAFNELANELINHMNKEEILLFPYIKRLNDAKNDIEIEKNLVFRSVINPINMMEYEHKYASQIVKKIKKLSSNYKAPTESCNTHKAFYSKLEEFEKDLFIHIHLENNILHPKAINLERKLKYQ
jgi:regulator of cell morphogenesis and NO signaling